MKVYIDGCSWTAGFGLPEGNSLADFVSRIDHTASTFNFSYSGKSNSSILDDAIKNQQLIGAADWVVIGLTTPYRYNMYTHNNQRIDFVPSGTSVVLEQHGNQTFVVAKDEFAVDQYQKSFYTVNNDHYHVLSTAKNYFALKSIAGDKLRCFSVHQHQDPVYDQCFDRNTWIHDWRYFPIMDEDFQPNNGHLDMIGMQKLAQMVLENVYG